MARVPRICAECGKKFPDSGASRITCSKACAISRSTAAGRAHACPPSAARCVVCGDPCKIGNKSCSRACAVTLQRQGGERAAAARKKEIAERPCEACGKMFGPSRPMSPSQFTAKFCSMECVRAERGTRSHPCAVCGCPAKSGNKTCSTECRHKALATALTVDTPPKDCEVCGQQFHRKIGERPNKWYERRYCSIACTGAGRHLEAVNDLPIKKCVMCENTLQPRDGEDARKFKRRSRCSRGQCTVDVAGVVLSFDDLSSIVGCTVLSVKKTWKRGGLGAIMAMKPRLDRRSEQGSSWSYDRPEDK